MSNSTDKIINLSKFQSCFGNEIVITEVVTLSSQEMRNLYLHDCRDIL